MNKEQIEAFIGTKLEENKKLASQKIQKSKKEKKQKKVAAINSCRQHLVSYCKENEVDLNRREYDEVTEKFISMLISTVGQASSIHAILFSIFHLNPSTDLKLISMYIPSSKQVQWRDHMYFDFQIA